jgi:uncharacterized protein YjeT (DUF2065 family)
MITAVYPVSRAFFRVEVDYTEGWNLYNAQRLVAHQPLYGVAYGWQTVNYPMLWFAFMAFLHRFTHEYLFTARAVSLLALAGCCTLVGLIVKHLSASSRAAILAGFFALGLFCTNANHYVGMDDCQLFADCFFLLGFYIFLLRPRSYAAIALTAAVFVLGGNIKHNPLDFPIAIFLELLILSRLRDLRRPLFFVAVGLVLAAVSVALNTHFGGPYFVTQMLAPRFWTAQKALDGVVAGLGPLLIPALAAFIAAIFYLRDAHRRIVGIFCILSLAIGTFFSGGSGVAVNTFFSFFLSIAIILGLVFADLEDRRWHWASLRLSAIPLRAYAAPSIFLWLIIPAMVNHVADPVALLRQTVADQRQFDREVALLQSQPTPAVCESLLRCYFAGKPYIYDPFNATRLIELHKLDPTPIYDGLRDRRFASVQLDEGADPRTQAERFPPSFLAEIQQNYQPVLVDKNVVIYAPKPSASAMLPANADQQPASQPTE